MKDIDRDPHLSAALRHAPDAGLSAPADISAQILAAAHRAAGEPALPARRRSFFAKPWRLGASGAFASLALAGVIGLLWRGEPTPGPAVERVADAAPAAAIEAPAAPAAAVAPPATVVVAAAPDPAQSARRVMALERPPAATPAPITANEAATPPMPAPVSPHVPVPVPAPVPMPAPAADTMMAATEATAARAARGEMLRAQGAQRAAAPAAVMAVPRPNGPWMDALAEGRAVQWWVDGESRAPTSSWLYALAAQTEGRWRPAGGTPPASTDNLVQWSRGEVPLGRLWLGAQRVLWCSAQGRCEEAALEADVASTLRKGLAR